jgi:hypothetical protein
MKYLVAPVQAASSKLSINAYATLHQVGNGVGVSQCHLGTMLQHIRPSPKPEGHSPLFQWTICKRSMWHLLRYSFPKQWREQKTVLRPPD